MFEKGCHGGPGRPKKADYGDKAEAIIKVGAKEAAEYLVSVARGAEKRPSVARIDACKYLINQAIGMPKQRQELTGVDGGPVEIKTIEVKLSGSSVTLDL